MQNDDLKELDACPICGKRPEWIDWYPISGYSRLKLWALRCSRSPHCVQTSYERDLDLTRHNWRRICERFECDTKEYGGGFALSAFVIIAAAVTLTVLGLVVFKQ